MTRHDAQASRALGRDAKDSAKGGDGVSAGQRRGTGCVLS